jgi:hypothetical protein
VFVSESTRAEITIWEAKKSGCSVLDEEQHQLEAFVHLEDLAVGSGLKAITDAVKHVLDVLLLIQCLWILLSVGLPPTTGTHPERRIDERYGICTYSSREEQIYPCAHTLTH